MISMRSMSSGMMSFSREATCEFCAPKEFPPAVEPDGPWPVALLTRTPST
jgi:hypothetical protein